MNLKKLEEIKKLAIMAMFSDDTLMENLVLKGGNALDIIYRIANRASLDLDFSIPQDIDLLSWRSRINDNLIKTFREQGLQVFDFKIEQRPRVPRPLTPDFWGGYCIEFKVVELELYDDLKADINALRRRSIEVAKDHTKIFSIEVSKYEYCEQKVEHELDGLTVYVYSPEMILLEKIRSICQQMPNYKFRLNPTPRAKDFFDIYTVDHHFRPNLLLTKNLKLLRNIFAAKEVPLGLMKDIDKYKGYHEPDFIAIADTVKPGTELHSYDFYFEFVVNLTKKLVQALGVE